MWRVVTIDHKVTTAEIDFDNAHEAWRCFKREVRVHSQCRKVRVHLMREGRWDPWDKVASTNLFKTRKGTCHKYAWLIKRTRRLVSFPGPLKSLKRLDWLTRHGWGHADTKQARRYRGRANRLIANYQDEGREQWQKIAAAIVEGKHQ